MRVALIAEGPTDQEALESVLFGFFEQHAPDLVVVRRQPTSGRDESGSYYAEALAFNDLVVVHVDTDVCEEVGFDIPRHPDPDVIAAAVQQKLEALIGPDVVADAGHRILFAIAVDSIECWLLPSGSRTRPRRPTRPRGVSSPSTTT